MATDVVKHGLDDMRCNVEVADHPRGNRTPHIVGDPFEIGARCAESFIESHLGYRPASKWPANATAEDEVIHVRA
jgi:hypothetical protein